MEIEPVIEKIVSSSNLSRDEVLKLVEAKKKELSGLVSEVGAAHIVANELGVTTLPPMRAMVRVSDLRAGLASLDVTLRVLRVFPRREFERKGVKGQVASLIVGDETGTVRFSLWGPQALLSEQLERGDIITVHGGYVKVDNQARPELRAGSRTKIEINPESERASELPEVDKIEDKGRASETTEKEIAHVTDGETARIRATLVSLIERSPFYQTCPKCKKTIRDGQCKEHGVVNPPERQLILSATLDDGTGSMRAVFFRKAAESFLGMSLAEATKAADLSDNEKIVFDTAKKKLGHEFIFYGRTKFNKMFERHEIVVNRMEEIDAEAETENLLGQLQ